MISHDPKHSNLRMPPEPGTLAWFVIGGVG